MNFCKKMFENVDSTALLVFQLKIISFLNFPKGDNILDNSVERPGETEKWYMTYG